ncbi:MAG: hypothetical protein ACI86H_001226 [bacterium]|jgi:hypothetical protein
MKPLLPKDQGFFVSFKIHYLSIDISMNLLKLIKILQNYHWVYFKFVL